MRADVKKIFKTVKKNSFKITPQRLETLRYLINHRTHPKADLIYPDLKEKNSSLSKTTVYDFLEIFKKHGVIQKLTISGLELQYDFKCFKHHHFICRKYGRTIDINSSYLHIEIRKEGYQLDGAHGYLIGICKKCPQREKIKVRHRGMERYEENT